MPVSTVKEVVPLTRSELRETLVFLCFGHFFPSLPFYFPPNDGLVTLKRWRVFWRGLLLIGNAGATGRGGPRVLFGAEPST